VSGELIMVVDDNPQNLKLARVALRSEGYDVATAADAEEALRLLETSKPRLILTDLQLPGMDGLALTRQLKADPTRRDIVVVALTAFARRRSPPAATATLRSRSTRPPCPSSCAPI
jgi:two-component system, cell cycle response regulator DivK